MRASREGTLKLCLFVCLWKEEERWKDLGKEERRIG
jgi:hypothetical protein